VDNIEETNDYDYDSYNDYDSVEGMNCGNFFDDTYDF
jgi:hypothetical protein